MPSCIDQSDIHVEDQRPSLHFSIERPDAAASSRHIKLFVRQTGDDTIFDDDTRLVTSQAIANAAKFLFGKPPGVDEFQELDGVGTLYLQLSKRADVHQADILAHMRYFCGNTSVAALVGNPIILDP